MMKRCDKCRCYILDAETVIAAVVTQYKEIDSATTFALSKPEECVNVYHEDCYYDKEEGEQLGE